MKCIVLLFTCILGLLNSANCYKILEHGLSEYDQKLIVSVHNKYRRLISQGKVPGQPAGKHLKTIKYDGHLAQLAQRLSDSCVSDHDYPKDDRWHNVGQNLDKLSSSGFQKGSNWNKVMESWFNEYTFYKYGGPIDDNNAHYTQIIWGDTEYIGCGYTFCETNATLKYEKLYVCNYGPAGNNPKIKPYTI